MKHEPITLEDPTRDGTGRAVLYRALTNLIRDREIMRKACMAQSKQPLQHTRDIQEAAHFMRQLYPENAHEVDQLLKAVGFTNEPG